MRTWRWVIALLIVLNAVSGAVPAIEAAAFKLGHHPASLDLHVLPLLQSLTWPVVVLWLASMGLFLVSAGLLVAIRGGALAVYALAFAGDLSVFLMMQGRAYDAAFNRGERTTSCIVFVLLVVMGGAIWYLDRQPSRAGAR